jgi:hypothetical protein
MQGSLSGELATVCGSYPACEELFVGVHLVAFAVVDERLHPLACHRKAMAAISQTPRTAFRIPYTKLTKSMTRRDPDPPAEGAEVII